MKSPSPGTNYTVISVESRKGGVGKTTAALVLANLLVETGSRVLFVDADITGTNTACAVRDSPIWRGRTKVLNLGVSNSEHDVLLAMFADFMQGRPVGAFFNEHVSASDLESAFLVIGSRLHEQKESLTYTASVLFDELHSYWFRMFLIELSETFSRLVHNSDPTQEIFIIVDNSPGFTGIAPELHDWLTDLGPERGKFLTVTSPDTQDIAACSDSIAAIHSRLELKCKVASWVKMSQNKENQSKELSDTEVNFLVRLLETKTISPPDDSSPTDDSLGFYQRLAQSDIELRTPSPSQYQGLVVNKVIPLFLDKSLEWSPHELIQEDSPARELLAPQGGVRRRIVQYDENLDMQFSQHLLKILTRPMIDEELVVHRLHDLADRLPSGVSMPTRLADQAIHPSELESALRNCRRAFVVLQHYIERCVRILDENNSAYISRLIRPIWFPRSPLENLRGSFINALAYSRDVPRYRDLPFYRGNSDIPLRLKAESTHLLNRLIRHLNHDSHREPSFLNSLIMVVGLSLVDFLHEDEWTEDFAKMLSDIAIFQEERYSSWKGGHDSTRQASFLVHEQSEPAREFRGRFRDRSHRMSEIAFKIYPNLCEAQARLLDIEGDAKLLGWAVMEAVRIGSRSPRSEIFLPDLRALLDPVIVEKSMSHSRATDEAYRLLQGSSYLQRFSEPLQDILNTWQIRQ
jgi:hypothetical protein